MTEYESRTMSGTDHGLRQKLKNLHIQHKRSEREKKEGEESGRRELRIVCHQKDAADKRRRRAERRANQFEEKLRFAKAELHNARAPSNTSSDMRVALLEDALAMETERTYLATMRARLTVSAEPRDQGRSRSRLLGGSWSTSRAA